MNPSAFWLSLGSAAAHAGWNFAARRSRGDLTVVWLGLCLSSVVFGPFALALGADARLLPYVAATGALNAAYFILLSKAYETGELSSVYPLSRGVGIAGIVLISASLLGERLTTPGLAGVALVAAGAFAIANSKGSARTAAVAAAVGLLSAVAVMIDREGVRLAHPLAYIGCLQVSIALCLAPYVLSRGTDGVRRAFEGSKSTAAVIGLGAAGGYLLVLATLRLAPASYVSAVREASVVLSALLGLVWLKEPLGASKALGLGAIAAGIGLIRWAAL